MIKKIILTVALFFMALPVHAGSLEFSLNDFSAQATVKQKISEDNFGASLVNAKILYNSKEDTTLGSVGLDVLGNIGVQGVQAGAGVKLYGGTTDKEDILSLALGALARVAPAAWKGFGFSGSIFWAPSVLSFLDADGGFDSSISVDYEFIPRARIFVSYNNIRIDIEDRGDVTADEAFRVGVELIF